jgi:hypothetical protein
MIFLNKANAAKYMEMCMNDYCAASKTVDPEIQARNKRLALCHIFSAMASECTENFLNIEWRRADRCRKLG